MNRRGQVAFESARNGEHLLAAGVLHEQSCGTEDLRP
jgi:hypothetical protein